MRHSIRRVGKRTLSIVLTLMMLVSTMVVGMVTFNAATIPKNTTIYLDLSNASGFKKDSNPIYLAVTASSNSSYSADNSNTSGAGSYKPASDKWYTMSNVSGNIWSATVTDASSVGKVSFFSDDESSYDNVWSTNCTLGRTYDGTNNMFVIGSSTYHTNIKSNIYGGSWSTYSGGSGGDTVTGDLLSVLKGEKVMFYAGEPSGWNQSTIYLYTDSEQSGDSVSKSGVSNGLSGYVLGAFCVAPDINYYVGHDKYAPYSVKPTAGAAYVLSGDESSSSGFTKISTNSSGNSLYSLNKGATLTATTTCDSSIQAGSSLNVNTSTAAGKSTIGKNNTIEYYIGDSAGNYSKYSLSNGTLDTSELADGTYTLKTVLSDGNIYVVGDTDTFTVESTQTLAKPGLAITDKGIITNFKSVTLTISNGSDFPDGTTFSLVDASGNTVKTLTSGNNTLQFSDTDIPTEEGKYTVVASCDGYKSSSSDEITLKKVQVYGVTLAVNNDADVSATFINAYGQSDTITEGMVTPIPVGNKVTVTVKAKAGYECSGLTVKTATDKNVTVTKNDDGTYSFTMPGENVTVTPTITAKQAANVTVSSNDDTRGTATLTTTGTIYVGDSFTVKAAPKSDNTFKDFTVTGATQVGTVKNADGSTTGTFKATAQNVTVTANFEENSGVLQTDKYLIYQYSQNDASPSLLTKSLPIYRLSDGTFIARFSEEEVANMQKHDIYFALSSSKNYSDIYWKDNQNVTVKTDPEDTALIYADLRNPDGGYKVGHIWLDNTQVIGMEIEVGVDDGKGHVQYPNYVVRPIVEQLPEGTVTVYAKDGTTISGGTADMAETRVLSGYDKILSEVETDTHCKYRSSKGKSLSIQTTMDSTKYANGYYVYAFCINGISYPALETSAGVYQTTYMVSGNEENSIVEITPVYCNKKIEEAGDYLTIYVDASQLEGRWGNTLSCYSYYYTGEYNDGKPVALETSGYPGQPMLLGTNGLYYTRFPRYSYDETGTKRINSNTNNPYLISGVTVNSFSEKELHGDIYPDLKDKNLQTFDYDDFIYISNLGFDTLKFEIQCRYSVSNQHTLLNGATNAPVMSGTINLSDYESKGWENFYDFDGNKIDIIGNKLSPEQQTKDPIYIVSTGNQNTALGQWSTVWYVYNSKGEYITQGHPSDFISRNADETTSNPETTAYEAIKGQGYEGVPVKICYESNVGADGNTGTRIDGRWYYTKSNQEATVDVSVQYRDDTSSDVWTNDTNETLTAVSGTATIDGVTSKTFEQRNVTAQLNAVPKNGYVFVAWGTVDDEGNYTKLSNIKTAASDFMVDTNYHLVARFEKVEEGSLILTHRKYVGPNAVGGNGYYLLSAVIKDSQDNELASFPITEGEIVIPNIQVYRGCKIEITMTTRMRGINTFVDWYMMSPEGDYDNITQSEDVWGKTGEVSQTIVQWVDNLYNNAELVLNTLHYYSDIARVSRDAVLNYKYYNRFNQEKTYVKHVELDEDDVVDGVYTITDKLIYDNAPAIEDLYKDCVWKVTEQTTSKNGTTATIWGIHSESPCNVHLDDGINPVVSTTVKYNNYLKNNNEFYKAPNANADGIPFAYWLVTKDGKEVAKCYANDFNLKIVDHYTITAVYEETRESSLTISEPKYTREQFTDESGNVKSDYLYVDFIVAYMNSNGILLSGDLASTMDYHTGLIVEFDRYIKVDDQNADDAKLTKPLTEYKYEDYDHTKLQNIATDDTKESGSLTVDGTRALYKFEINNADYNNKNRIDYFVKFDNKNKSFRRYVMKAYYYVYYTDSNGKTVYQQTEPVYFCLFETGNSTAVTSENNNSSVTE